MKTKTMNLMSRDAVKSKIIFSHKSIHKASGSMCCDRQSQTVMYHFSNVIVYIFSFVFFSDLIEWSSFSVLYRFFMLRMKYFSDYNDNDDSDNDFVRASLH